MSQRKNEALLETLLQGKLPHNLSWATVVDLVEHLGEVETHGQEFAFHVRGQRAFFKKPHGHEQLGTEEVAQLRSFLRAAMEAVDASSSETGRTVVVVDHNKADIYDLAVESTTEPVTTVRPYDPNAFHHHLVHRKEAHYRGDRVPEEKSYYDYIAASLHAAREIALIGNATGTSSSVDVFVQELKKHHSGIATRIIAIKKVDLTALSSGELLEYARGLFDA